MSDAKDVRTKQNAGGDIQSRSSGLALDAPPFVPRGSQEQRPGLLLSSNVNAAPFVPASYSAANQNDSGTARSGEEYVLYTFDTLDICRLSEALIRMMTTSSEIIRIFCCHVSPIC